MTRSNPSPLVGEGAERMLSSEAGEGFVNEPTTLRPFTRLSLAFLDFAALSCQGEREFFTANYRRSAGCARRPLPARWSRSHRKYGTPGRHRTASPAPPRRPRLPAIR